MDVVYMKCFSDETDGDDFYSLPLSSLIVTFVAQWTLSAATLRVVLVKTEPSEADDVEPRFSVPVAALEPFSPAIIRSTSALPSTVQMCTSPSVLVDSKWLCVSGLCGVLRHILKISSQDAAISLLGFRRSCLIACAEVSVWTKFCEVDLIHNTRKFVLNSKYVSVQLPSDISRFEGHMRHPLRTHNIGKKEQSFVRKFSRLALDEKKATTQQEFPSLAAVSEASVIEKSILTHEYAEDVTMTLADLVILVCVHQILIKTGSSWSSLHRALPSVLSWYQRMTADEKVRTALLSCGMTPFSQNMTNGNVQQSSAVSTPPICSKSLYKRDVKRYNPCSRVYTRQNEVQTIIDKLLNSSITPEYTNNQVFKNAIENWDALPKAVHPSFGDMPKSRLNRKCEQLENMANAICSIASDGETIVDFCSGGGHLGILLAFLLPKCRVIMIENKESSVDRAVLRASTLPNTTVIQCNLDYFEAKFDLGVALHACGVATDLVLQRCMDVGASFVVCPCCYGGVRDTHLLSYPRSQRFRNLGLSSEEYYFLGHAADQTHENGHKNEQGKHCMGLVDTDRKYEAESAGYRVRLYTMKPATCTPKNNILLGVKPETK